MPRDFLSSGSDCRVDKVMRRICECTSLVVAISVKFQAVTLINRQTTKLDSEL